MTENINKGISMPPAAMSLINGFCMGIGLILAAALMRVVLHMGFCG